jgi:CheY-like chemotaxis protein
MRVQLVHWNEAEGRERARELRAAGLLVAYEPDAPAALRALQDELPDAVAIDLTRLPSHGRELAWALRQRARTRRVPLVFLGGVAEKVARIRGELPDAIYADWDGAVRALERAAAPASGAARAEPVVPRQTHFYAAKPLAAKLGWKPGATLALDGAPDGFERTLGAPPAGAKLVKTLRGRCDLVLWFVRSEKELTRALPALAKAARAADAGTRVWVGWPKKGSRVATDLTGERVRTAPHAVGLVDYKICALDADWSGICFARRKV